MTGRHDTGEADDRRAFLKALGVGGAAAAGAGLDDLRAAVDASADELVAIGATLRAGDGLDAAALDAALADLGAAVTRLPEIRAAGVPDGPDGPYRELAEPAWAVSDRLAAAGFFERAEAAAPAFTPEHVEATAREVVASEALAGVLADAGFGEEEVVALVADVVAGRDRLALWVPARDIPDAVEAFDPGDVAPLHQRAVEGTALWLGDLDRFLWQREHMLPDAALDDAADHARTMLGGVALVTAAARESAAPDAFTDGERAAALSAGAAAAVRGQERLAADVFRLSDDDRAPRGGGP